MRGTANVTAEGRDKIQRILDEGIFEDCIEIMHNVFHTDRVRREMCFTVINVCAEGTAAHVIAVVEMGFVPALIATMNNSPFRNEREMYSFAKCKLRAKRESSSYNSKRNATLTETSFARSYPSLRSSLPVRM